MTMHCSTYISGFTVKFFFQPIHANYISFVSWIQNHIKFFYSGTVDQNETKFDWNGFNDVLFQNFVLQPCPLSKMVTVT